ncbi:MAG: ribonuclease III [Gammaproteobacteria bacterium]|jgi:ribonuclease-3
MVDHVTLARYLGYLFKNPELLHQALSHRSVTGENYERLEFLGDAIVNFVIADALFKRFPEATEGQLTRIRASLVNQQTLSEIADELMVSDYINLGVGELKSGGARRPSILADAVEAIIAAIYLDSNLEKCQDCVFNWYAARLDYIKLDESQKDPKTLLQEYVQARKMPLPIYRILSIKGAPHDQEFCVECEVQNLEQRPQGKGRSRRAAEQIAASLTLAALEQNEQ